MIGRIMLFALLAPLGTLLGFSQSDAAAYVDSSGAQHVWRITSGHGLYWDGSAYTPSLLPLLPQTLSSPSSDAAWAADKDAIDQLAKHHAGDVLIEMPIVDPVNAPAASVALQRIVNYLDSQKIRYGVDLGKHADVPYAAVLDCPAIYRIPAPNSGQVAYFRHIPGVVGGHYALVAGSDGSFISSGDATVSDNGELKVALGTAQGGEGTVLLCYPKCMLEQSEPNRAQIPDVWAGSDDLRDNLLIMLRGVHFGPGLRFFVDPLGDNMDVDRLREVGIIPDSDAFRQQFKAWLDHKYSDSVAQLNISWNSRNQDIPDFDTAANSFPLWFQARGISVIFDPATSKEYDVTVGGSKLWGDIEEFETDSLRTEMNKIAAVLKSTVANVPVIYRWTGPNSVYKNTSEGDGYDGFIVTTSAHGDEIASAAAGYALSTVSGTKRLQWLIGGIDPSTATSSSAGLEQGDQKSTGYSRQDLTDDREAFGSLGIFGYLLGDVPTGSELHSVAKSMPQVLDWCAADAQNMSIAAQDSQDNQPDILFYPADAGLPHASIRRLSTGIWWLPSDSEGQRVDLGPDIEGYRSVGSDGKPQYVVYALDKPVVMSLPLDKTARPLAFLAGGEPIRWAVKKDVFSITLTSTPVVITGLADMPLPLGAVDAQFKVVNALLDRGKASNVPMTVFEQRVFYLKNTVDSDEGQTRPVYNMVSALAAEMRLALSSYVWIEGEDTSQENFDGAIASPGSSGGAFLWLDEATPPSASDTYEASYDFSLAAEGDYDIWMSVAPGAPGSKATSAFSLGVDQNAALSASTETATGMPYGSLAYAGPAWQTAKFVWIKAGHAHMDSGGHTLHVIVNGVAPKTNRYTLGIDCFCVTLGSFKPDGIVKPQI
jgi:hypothetical protein